MSINLQRELNAQPSNCRDSLALAERRLNGLTVSTQGVSFLRSCGSIWKDLFSFRSVHSSHIPWHLGTFLASVVCRFLLEFALGFSSTARHIEANTAVWLRVMLDMRSWLPVAGTGWWGKATPRISSWDIDRFMWFMFAMIFEWRHVFS